MTEFIQKGFILSTTAIWFLSLGLPIYVMVSWDPFGLVSWAGRGPGRGLLLFTPLLIANLVFACATAGVYYAIGRRVLMLIGLWKKEPI